MDDTAIAVSEESATALLCKKCCWTYQNASSSAQLAEKSRRRCPCCGGELKSGNDSDVKAAIEQRTALAKEKKRIVWSLVLLVCYVCVCIAYSGAERLPFLVRLPIGVAGILLGLVICGLCLVGLSQCKNIFALLAVGIVGLIGLSICTAAGSWAFMSEEAIKAERHLEELRIEHEKREDDKYGAITAAQSFVEKRLKSPSSASFPWSGQTAYDLGGGRWKVSAYVDAQNSFGATIRENWTAVVIKDYGSWRLESVSIGD